MTLRTAVSVVLLASVGMSSVEVLFGDAGPVGSRMIETVDAVTEDEVVPAASGPEESSDDCPCLCACVCSGAQLVVAPQRTSFDFSRGEARTTSRTSLRHLALPAPRPHLRPPIA